MDTATIASTRNDRDQNEIGYRMRPGLENSIPLFHIFQYFVALLLFFYH